MNLPKLDINWLNTFKTVVREQSVTRAAYKLHANQPTVSYHLRCLESHFGATLIERQPFALTASGLRVLELADKMVGDLHRYTQAIRNDCSGVSGTVKVALNNLCSHALMSEPLQRLRERFSGVSLSLFSTWSNGTIEMVASGNADFGVIFKGEHATSCAYTSLGQSHFYAVGPSADTFTQEDRLPGCGHPMIVLAYPDGTIAPRIEKFVNDMKDRVSVVMRVDTIAAQMQWVRAGVGIAVVPGLAFENPDYANMPRYKMESIPPLEVGLIQRPASVPTPAVKFLISEVVAQAAPLV